MVLIKADNAFNCFSDKPVVSKLLFGNGGGDDGAFWVFFKRSINGANGKKFLQFPKSYAMIHTKHRMFHIS